MQELRQSLEAEVTKFRVWADNYPISERSGEWECGYSEWQDIYNAFRAYVQPTGYRNWDQKITEDLLYLIARDNECEALIRETAKRSDDLLYLAENAVSSQERDTKWQIAVELGKLNTQRDIAEKLLLQFAHDPEEYVRRRALMALADLGSTQIEELAAVAWDTIPDWDWDTTSEFQAHSRIAALYSLRKVGSSKLEEYLARAEGSGQRFLVEYAARIRNGEEVS
jgi:HEAT repeat protein